MYLLVKLYWRNEELLIIYLCAKPHWQNEEPLITYRCAKPHWQNEEHLITYLCAKPHWQNEEPLITYLCAKPHWRNEEPLITYLCAKPHWQNEEPLSHIFVPSPIGEINLHPIDALYDDLKAMNNDKDFNPAQLNLASRDSVLPLFYSYMKKIAETSNNNLIRNSNAFLASGGKIDPASKFEWIDSSMEETQKKFQMSY